MERRLTTARLRHGLAVEILCVTAPDAHWREAILAFLAHKPPEWLTPLRLALEGALPDLPTHFYLAVTPAGQIITNVTLVEAGDPPVGLLQHVYTHPNHRQQGAARAVLTAATADFDARGGVLLTLSTGYQTPPYFLYQRVGFIGRGTTGAMVRCRTPDAEAQLFTPGPTTVRPVAWGDFPGCVALHLVEGGWTVRSVAFGVHGPRSFEGAFVRLMDGLSGGGAWPVRAQAARVLVTRPGAVVGLATLCQTPHWREALLLDLFVHPAFQDQAPALLAALPLPAGGKLQAFAEPEATEKTTLLLRQGFVPEGLLRAQVRVEGTWRDVLVLGRWPR